MLLYQYIEKMNYSVGLIARMILVSICVHFFLVNVGQANAASAPGIVNLTILHDNDLHGHLLPFAYTEIGKSPLEQPSRGGAARRATLIRELRKSIKNPVLLVDSGDIATRGPLATTYKGLADVAAMNFPDYNHDVGASLCAKATRRRASCIHYVSTTAYFASRVAGMIL